MSASDSVGFAILGAGMVAEYHQQAIAANADKGAHLMAMGHYNPERFADIEEQFGAPCLTQDDLLGHPDIDVVCICTPSGQHAAQTIACAQAGKHVIVEKPLALNLADADAMIRACAENEVKLAVALQRRATPRFQQIYQAIRVGDLGELTLGTVTIPYFRPQTYYEQADWRGTWALDGGGVIMNQGIHLVDLLIWYMGDPVEVNAYANTLRRNIEVEDTLVATLRFANGAMATISATTTAEPGFPHRIEIYGTQGGIQIEGEDVARWVVADPASAVVEPPEAVSTTESGAGSDPRGIKPTGHIAIIRDLIEALREGRNPAIDGSEGRRSVAAILAMYEAAGLHTHSG